MTLAAILQTASEVFCRSRAVATGFKPSAEFDATGNYDCPCDFCQGFRAARALHADGSGSLDLELLDADLQRVIHTRNGLPAAISKAIVALVSSRDSCSSASSDAFKATNVRLLGASWDGKYMLGWIISCSDGDLCR